MNQRQCQHDREENPRQCRRVPHVQIAERLVENMIGVEERRVDRAALRHDECLGEDLEHADQADDEIEEDDLNYDDF